MTRTRRRFSSIVLLAAGTVALILFIEDWNGYHDHDDTSKTMTPSATTTTTVPSPEAAVLSALDKVQVALKSLEHCPIMPDPTCSCTSHRIYHGNPDKRQQRQSCCARHFVGVHKMGHFALRDYRAREFPFIKAVYAKQDTTAGGGGGRNRFRDATTTITATAATSRSGQTTTTTSGGGGGDFREVMVVRDLYAALVSGYLYHKSGRECWVDWNGNFNNTSFNHKEAAYLNNLDWQHTIAHLHDLWKWPEPFAALDDDNVSICRYLVDQPEEIGMKVYTNFAMVRWIVPMLDLAKKRRQGTCTHRTIYLCLDDLDPASDDYAPLTHRLQIFFLDDETRRPAVHPLPPATKTKDHSSHSTSHDPVLRQRLKQYIQEIDHGVWNGRIAKDNPTFQCRSEIG